MQRRRSTSSFFPEISSLSHGSNVSNLGLIQQNVDSVNAPDAKTGTSHRLLEERHSEPNSDKTLSIGPVTLGPSILQSANSDAIPQKLDLNVAYENSNGNICQEVGANSSLVGSAEIFERNTRRRITPANEQSFPPSSMYSLVHVNNTSQTLQPSYCNWITSPSSGSVSSISPVILANGSDALRVEENSRYIPRSTSVQRMLLPGSERRNSGQNPITLRNYSPRNHSFQNGFASVQLSAPPGFPQHNVTRGFQNGFTAGIHPSSTPSSFPRRSMADEYAERLSNIVNHSRMRLASSGSEGQTTNHPLPSVSGRLESGVGNVRASQALRRPGVLTIRDEGRNAVIPSILPHIQPFVATQWRARLVQHALEMLQRVDGATLQYEDGIIFHDPLFYEEQDVHANMRLDVDNMSYEELLALEEQIGNVNTGLSEEAILAGVRQSCYQSMKLGPPVEEVPCCICQDDYVDEEELAKLNCGHDFHFNCIKQWLMQKNICPICKTTAVAV